jgi:hypothetical protein
MTRAGTRAWVAGTGLVVALAVAAGLAVVGGPEAGRRDRRDETRLADIRRIAEAVACHAEAGAEPPAPADLAAISPACLGGATGGLVDPATAAAYPIEYPAADLARVCAGFEQPARADRWTGWPPFDPATGCVTVSLTAAGG